MGEREFYSSFDEQDKSILKKLWVKRWKDVAKRFVFSFALPFSCAGTIVQSFQFFPISLSDLSSLYKMILLLWTPVFFIIGLGNLLLFTKYLPSLLVDRTRGIKKTIQFYPSTYCLPEFDKYYIKTWLPDYPYFQISYEYYNSLNTNELLSLEVAPFTKKFLALKNVDATKTIDVIPE